MKPIEQQDIPSYLCGAKLSADVAVGGEKTERKSLSVTSPSLL